MQPDAKKNAWKMFNQISQSYDKVNRILSLGQDKRWRKKLISHLPLRPHLQILDLATGTADQLIAFANGSISIQRMVGVDLAEEMMAIGKAKLPHATFITADAQKLPFPAEQFDATSISFGIRNIPDPLLALKEMHRVLKPYGKALVLEFSIPNRLIRPFFLFYLRNVLPKLGAFFSNNLTAYQYLNQTIETFPSGQSFCDLLIQAGFKNPKIHTMNFGAVTLYTAEK